MSGFGIAVAIIALALIVGVVLWLVLNRKLPESASGHERDGALGHGSSHPMTTDRPAGPGAEPTNPDRLGGDQRLPLTEHDATADDAATDNG